MRLATRKNGTRDGSLVVVRSDGAAYADAKRIAPTLQAALDDWARVEPLLRGVAEGLEIHANHGQPLELQELMAPLPRAYEWVDGSAYLNHVRVVRKARGAEPPETLTTDPLVYQGGSSVLLGPSEHISLGDVKWGMDFEAEVCVVLSDVAEGTPAARAEACVRLILLANDVSLRNLIPVELAKGFGFFQSKPATGFSPFAVTPDELGPAWREGRVHLKLRSTYNGRPVGDVDAGAGMHFSFFDLIAHIARTRSFGAGTILGGGTVSNEDDAQGVSCLAELRAKETLERGEPLTPFMKPGDRVEIEMFAPDGRSVFGRIDQKVVAR